MPKKLKVAVLMGGKSPEHEVSLISGSEVVKNLDPEKYEILPIVVSKDGTSWQIRQRDSFYIDSPATKKVHSEKLRVKNLVKVSNAAIIKDYKVDLVFIVMHGPFGEDGIVQGFLDLIGLPYTGSRVLASALGMNKIYSRKLFIHAGLNTPDYIELRFGDSESVVWRKFDPPVFVHSHNQGSAIGSSLVKDKKQLKAALRLAWRYSQIALVDEYLKGVEVTCAILGNDKPTALPLVEIRTKHEFFDYEAKYNERLTDEIVPAEIDLRLAKKVQGVALRAYQAIGCIGFGRVDMIIVRGKVYVLEVNTIPGLTPVSLFPKAAKAAGISYSDLLSKIIGYALHSNP